MAYAANVPAQQVPIPSLAIPGTGVAAPTKKRKRNINTIGEFSRVFLSDDGFPRFYEMVRHNPQLMLHDPSTATHIPKAMPNLGLVDQDGNPIDSSADDLLPGTTPTHHKLLAALVTSYYEWNHMTFVKIPMKETVQFLQRVGHKAVFPLQEFEAKLRLKKQRLEDDQSRRQRAVAAVEQEDMDAIERQYADAERKQQTIDELTQLESQTQGNNAARLDDLYDELLRDANAPPMDYDMMDPSQGVGFGGGVGGFGGEDFDALIEDE
jgi:hypothetical protein